ncbi:hypothetical protein CDD81_3441 [Ophiocordyceps australis]|uniref:Uncharacterized protein n=1 Tax=Ophiocordyceps australis TaxID=1399860 RepID=A0A2C5YBP5_9HYPO|nr:hypothetical protein CDD81_3441 [Ophiocordyceps australis]
MERLRKCDDLGLEAEETLLTNHKRLVRMIMSHQELLRETLRDCLMKQDLKKIEDKVKLVEQAREEKEQLEARQQRRLARIEQKANRGLMHLPFGDTTLPIHDTLSSSRYYIGHEGGDYIFRYLTGEFVQGWERCLESPPDSETDAVTDSDHDPSNQVRHQDPLDYIHGPMLLATSTSLNLETNMRVYDLRHRHPLDLPSRIRSKAWDPDTKKHSWLYCGQVPRSYEEYDCRLADMVPILTALFFSLLAFDENGEDHDYLVTDETLSPLLVILAQTMVVGKDPDNIAELESRWTAKFPEGTPAWVREALLYNPHVREFYYLLAHAKMLGGNRAESRASIATFKKVIQMATGARFEDLSAISFETKATEAFHDLLHEPDKSNIFAFKDIGVRHVHSLFLKRYYKWDPIHPINHFPHLEKSLWPEREISDKLVRLFEDLIEQDSKSRSQRLSSST